MRETEWRGIAAGLWRDGETEAESARAALRETLDEIDRLRALPVLATCGPCRGLVPDRTRLGFRCAIERRQLDVDAEGRPTAPPEWCRLRGVR